MQKEKLSSSRRARWLARIRNSRLAGISNWDLYSPDYYDDLSKIFEKAAWAGIFWGLVVTIVIPSKADALDNTFVLLFFAALFNYVYFRVIYPKIRQQHYRFYSSELIFPFFVWLYIHFNAGYAPFLSMPYFLVIVSTSLTLRRIDTIIALASSSFFIILEDFYFRMPVEEAEIRILVSQLFGLFVFTWVSLKLSDWIKLTEMQNEAAVQDISDEMEKTSILKKYASEMVIDRQKAQIIMDEFATPVLIIDTDNKIVEVNQAFEKVSDFKKSNLYGRTLEFVLQLSSPINYSSASLTPEEFDAVLLTRRGKERKVHCRDYFLLDRTQKLAQVLIFIHPSS